MNCPSQWLFVFALYFCSYFNKLHIDYWLKCRLDLWKNMLPLFSFFPSKVSLKNCRPCQFYANPFVLHISVSNTRRLMVNPLELMFSDIIKAYSVFICTRMINIPAQRNLRLFQSVLWSWLHTGTSLLIVSSKTALKRIINETLKDTQTSAAE